MLHKSQSVVGIFSVHPLLAFARPAQAGDLVVVLVIKLVVIRQFFAPRYPFVGEDDDVVVPIDFYCLGDAVRLATVVDVARHPSAHGGVQDPLVVQPEHVNAAVLSLVPFLPHIREV